MTVQQLVEDKEEALNNFWCSSSDSFNKALFLCKKKEKKKLTMQQYIDKSNKK